MTLQLCLSSSATARASCGVSHGQITVTPPSFSVGSSGNCSRSLFSSSTSASVIVGGTRNRRGDAKRQVALLPDLIEQLAALRRVALTDCMLVMPRLCASPMAARSAASFSARVGCGHDSRHQVDGVVLEHAGGLARAAILHDDP